VFEENDVFVIWLKGGEILVRVPLYVASSIDIAVTPLNRDLIWIDAETTERMQNFKYLEVVHRYYALPGISNGVS